jgi:hypothetical protein
MVRDRISIRDKLDRKIAAVTLSAAEFNVMQARQNLVARMQATPLTIDEEMLKCGGSKMINRICQMTFRQGIQATRERIGRKQKTWQLISATS